MLGKSITWDGGRYEEKWKNKKTNENLEEW